MIYIAWSFFAMIAAIFIGYGLYIEKRMPQKFAAFGLGGVSAFFASVVDFAAVNWFSS